jgi:hypothetical protein
LECKAASVEHTLEVETRGFKGPRVYDASGLPLHRDNQSIFKERIYLDKTNPDILHDEITVIDNVSMANSQLLAQTVAPGRWFAHSLCLARRRLG